MNLMDFYSRGARHAPTDADRRRAKVTLAAETTRKQWLNALMVDETRTWMGVGEADRGAIEGMVTMLAIAGFAHAYDAHDADTVDLRIIRGAISAADQCMRMGAFITGAEAKAFSSAAGRARAILETASVDGIVRAAAAIRETVGLEA